jgi:uncharacterized protein
MRSSFAFGWLHLSVLGFWRAETLTGRRMCVRLCVNVCAAGMTVSTLIDTGAILALLDRTDRWHRLCVEAFDQLRLPLLTSEAVLTELFHLVGDSRSEMEAAWRLVRCGAIVLGAIEDSELAQLQTLMYRYADRPMDFADATLVYLAKREGLTTIFTVDHADFETYRIEGRRRFRVVPATRP